MAAHARPTSSFSTRCLNGAVCLLPALLLGILAVRLDSQSFLIGGTALTLCGLFVWFQGRAWRPPTSALAIAIYLMAYAWCWYPTATTPDRVAAAVRAILMIVPMGLLFAHDLNRTGAEARRRVKKYCNRLQMVKHWPQDLLTIAQLPAVRSLKAAAAGEPGPIFDLLQNPKPELRAAGFAALAGLHEWRPAELALAVSQLRLCNEPSLKTLAVRAIGGVNDAATLAEVTNCLRDSASSVREATAQVLLNGVDSRWAHIREGVRIYLSDSRFEADGGFPGVTQLAPIVVCDLANWATEPDAIGRRSIRALVNHYTAAIQSSHGQNVVTDLLQQVGDPAVPTELRVELAQLLQSYNLLTPALLDELTNANQPAPLRLLAADSLLQANPNDPDGIDVLRGLGRQGNRELAIHIAAILQHRYQLDMGLPPDIRTMTGKQVAEVVRRVQSWAGMRVQAGQQTPARGSPGLSDDPPPGLKITSVPPQSLPTPSRLKPGKSPW